MPPDDSLTPRARELLVILTERGEWVSRAELAQALGKQNLTAYETAQLEFMEGKGRIEVRRSRALNRQVWEYRAK